jgi:hypothetical protein
MKLFLRKYVLVLLISISIYTILFLLKKNEISYFNFDFYNILIISLLIRLFDDYVDYEKDVINKKMVFKKPVIITLICLLFTVSIAFVILSKNYLFLSILGLLLLDLFKEIKFIKYLKILYIPLLIMGLTNIFGFNIIYIIIAVILGIGDLVLIYRKG